MCDLTIQYPETPTGLRLPITAIPKSSWPRPKRLRAPFNKGFTDYVRVAGPGVMVGLGYRTEAEIDEGSGLPLFPSPIYFAMAKSHNENLVVDDV